jgi:hypothetical protein
MRLPVLALWPPGPSLPGLWPPGPDPLRARGPQGHIRSGPVAPRAETEATPGGPVAPRAETEAIP